MMHPDENKPNYHEIPKKLNISQQSEAKPASFMMKIMHYKPKLS